VTAALGGSGTLPTRHVAPRVTTVPLPSLRYWRIQRAWHQEELARAAGVSMATLWRLETGRPATLETVRKLAHALDVTPADLQRQPPMA
jgi:transcriptional regulator with XRE-family HTH domain